MSYGPGYVLWQQILRERAERRAERLEARRAAAPPAEAPATVPRRGRPPRSTGARQVDKGAGRGESKPVPARVRAARAAKEPAPG